MTVLEKVNVLQRVPLFQDVRTESLARVAALAQEVNFDARHDLFRENAAADSMFVVIEGLVGLARDGKPGDTAGPGQVVGAHGLLSGGTQTDSASALQPTQTLQIDQQDFFDVMAEDFNITRGILRALLRP